ncbi:MAG: alpha/beta hydrolase [bacterium]
MFRVGSRGPAYKKTRTNGVIEGQWMEGEDPGPTPGGFLYSIDSEPQRNDRFERLTSPSVAIDPSGNPSDRRTFDVEDPIRVNPTEASLLELMETIGDNNNVWWDGRVSNFHTDFTHTLPVSGWLQSEPVEPPAYHPVARASGSRGKEPVFCLVHGFTGDPVHWTHVQSYVDAEGFGRYTAHVPGHGLSYHRFADYTYQSWIRSIGEVARYLKRNRDRLVGIGLSMGGVLLLQNYQQFDAIVVINTPWKIGDWRMKFLELLQWFKRYHFAENSDKCLPVKSVMDVRDILKQLRRKASEIDVPVLVMNYRDDTVVPPESAEQLVEHLPDATWWEFEEGGHESPRDPETARRLWSRTCRWLSTQIGEFDHDPTE